MISDENYKISIIVPVYNLENELSPCIQSICSQTYHNLEIIVVDDGSTDMSRERISELAQKDDRIRVIFKENGGVTSARLAGCRIATGEYIGFVDGDDFVEEDMYEILVTNALKYQADISHCGYKVVYNNGKTRELYGTGRLVKQDKITGLKDLLSGEFIEPGLWNKLFHKTLFHSLLHEDLMDTSVRINEDLLMNYYLFKEARQSVFIDVCKYHYMAKANSPLSKNRIFDPIRVKQLILENSESDVRRYAQKALLATAVYTYCGLTLKRNRQFWGDRESVRQIVVENKNAIEDLPCHSKILAKMICRSPAIMCIAYPLYERLLQRKKYE